MAAQESLWWRYGDVDDGNFAVRRRSVPILVALLLVLVCFVTVCLYLRRACYRYSRDATLPRYSASSSSPLAPGNTASVAGLDDAAIAGLPVTMYQPGGAGAGDAAQCCSICLGEFAEGEKVKALPRCGHPFHPECVDPWLRARGSCPLCRASLVAAATTKPDGVGSEAV